MDAVVYTSNTGFTAEYANMLGEKLGLPVFSLKDSKSLASGSKVIYLGWLMASQVKGYKKAAKRFDVCAVCGVGMGASGTQLEEVRKANSLSGVFPLFTLQGGFEMKKLHGIYRFMMQAMSSTLGKQVADKPNKTPMEEDMLDLLKNGGSRVSEDKLEPVLEWCASNV